MRNAAGPDDHAAGEPAPFIELHLYIASTSPRSNNAVAAVTHLCRTRLAGRCRLEVVDIKREPRRAVEDQIVAVPVLVRTLPEPRRALLGDLQHLDRVLAGLELL